MRVYPLPGLVRRVGRFQNDYLLASSTVLGFKCAPLKRSGGLRWVYAPRKN